MKPVDVTIKCIISKLDTIQPNANWYFFASSIDKDSIDNYIKPTDLISYIIDLDYSENTVNTIIKKMQNVNIKGSGHRFYNFAPSFTNNENLKINKTPSWHFAFFTFGNHRSDPNNEIPS